MMTWTAPVCVVRGGQMLRCRASPENIRDASQDSSVGLKFIKHHLLCTQNGPENEVQGPEFRLLPEKWHP